MPLLGYVPRLNICLRQSPAWAGKQSAAKSVITPAATPVQVPISRRIYGPGLFHILPDDI